MTIDEMLDKIAQREGVKAPAPAQKPAPLRQEASGCSCGSHKDGGCSCSPRKEDGHKCSCGSHKEDGGHKCSGCGKCSHKALDLALAKSLAQGIEAAAAQLGVKVVVAIVNEGANLMCLHAMDDSYIASIRAAQEKAYTAVALKMPTHVALAQSRGGALDGYTNGNGILMLGGGFPLERGGRIFGGIGVSGGTKEQDILLSNIGAEVFRRISP